MAASGVAIAEPVTGAARYAGYYAGHCMAFLKRILELHRYIRLRRRYILTGNGGLRLRYAVSLWVVFGFLSAPVLGRPFAMAVAALGEREQGVTPVAYADSGAASLPNALARERLRQQSGGMKIVSTALRKAPKRNFEEVEIGKGDTLAGVLESAGVNGDDSYKVVKALSAYYDPRDVKPGQKVRLYFHPASAQETAFSKMTMKVDPTREITVRKKDDAFVSDLMEKDLVRRSYVGQAKIETSLYGSAARAGIPSQVIAEVIRIYSWNIDFQRDIQPGDRIEVLYEADETEDGGYARYGNVLYANLTVAGRDVPIYRYEMADGRIDYFEPDGISIRKTLMKTPIDGARISSGFGMRRHPVLGYNKMHKGMDFAASTGTPIYAAGDGIVEYAGRYNSYGNYARIRHNTQLKTAYAHMSRFAGGVKPGKRVRQGEVIGYVGTTGRSTGPHLHYEVLVNNAQTNPKSVNLPTGEQLQGRELRKFRDMLSGIRQQYVSLAHGMKFAQAGSPASRNLN